MRLWKPRLKCPKTSVNSGMHKRLISKLRVATALLAVLFLYISRLPRPLIAAELYNALVVTVVRPVGAASYPV